MREGRAQLRRGKGENEIHGGRSGEWGDVSICGCAEGREKRKEKGVRSKQVKKKRGWPCVIRMSSTKRSEGS